MPYEKVGKNEPVCIADEVPFDIPESWEWVRWGTLSESIQYGYNAPAQEHGRIKMVRISDIQDNEVLWETVPYCDIKESEIATYLLKPNDILFARTGGTVGKSYLVQDVPEEAIYAGYLIRTRYSDQLCPQYLKYFMESELYWSQLREGTIATAQPNCNGKTLGNMLVPIPPLSEQLRIVKKLNTTMVYVTEYGAAYSRSDSLNITFPELLKKSILQEAVQGKLVPQDSADEPASILLERIRAEKQKLIAEGKIKKDKHESVIFRRDNSHYEKLDGAERCINDEIPFEIPENWRWVRFSEIALFENGDRSSKYPVETDYVPDGIPFFGAKDMAEKYMSFDDVRYISEEKFAQLGNGKLQNGDLICLLRGSVGKTRIFRSIEKYSTGFICAQMLIIRCLNLSILDYVYATISSPYYTKILETKTTGTAVRQLPAKEVARMLIPLPPLSEQRRIVEKQQELLNKITLIYQ